MGSGASRGRGLRVLAMTSIPATQSVHASLAVQARLAGMWCDSGPPLRQAQDRLRQAQRGIFDKFGAGSPPVCGRTFGTGHNS